MNTSNSTTNSNAATPNSADSSTTNASSSTTASSGEKIGIPECDEFITKYDACVSKHVPEMVRAQYKEGIQRWRDEWRKTAANPATRGTLASQCKQIAEQQKATMKPFGCDF